MRLWCLHELQELDTLFHAFLMEKDYDAACACVGLALGSIWEIGREFSRSGVWNKRAKQLWDSCTISPLAHATLLLHFCFTEIAAGGDVILVHAYLTTILSLAEETGSSSIFLMYSALGAYIYCWKADFAAFEIVLDDTSPYCEARDASPVAISQHMISRGLFTLLQGGPKEGQAIFSAMLAAPNLDQMPPSMWLLLHGHYLYCLVSTGDQQGIEIIADTLRKKVIPEQNVYFHAYLHFNLGIAALAQSRPHKALLHCEEALRLGSLCDSANVVRMSALPYGQALADLGRHDDAVAHFSHWLPKWQIAEYYFIAALACVEMSRLYLKQNKIDQAQYFLRQGYNLIPAQEKILSLYRPTDYVIRLEQALRSRTVEIQASGKPVSITTLGNFLVTIEGRTIGKKQWKGRQSKKLLQAIISLGGSNISVSYLADLLWPDSDGDRAANSFKVCLSRLRKVITDNGSCPSCLIVKQKQISLLPEFCSIDAHLFEDEIEKVCNGTIDLTAIQYALSLYTGNFLEIEGDERWHIHKRDDLRNAFIQATLLLFKHHKRNNAVKTGLPYLIRALKFDPLNENVLTQAIESYVTLGNRGKAIDMYDKACQLRKERYNLGTEEVSRFFIQFPC